MTTNEKDAKLLRDMARDYDEKKVQAFDGVYLDDASPKTIAAINRAAARITDRMTFNFGTERYRPDDYFGGGRNVW